LGLVTRGTAAVHRSTIEIALHGFARRAHRTRSLVLVAHSRLRWGAVFVLLFALGAALSVVGATSPTVTVITPTSNTMQSATSATVDWTVDDGHDSVAYATFTGDNANTWGSASLGGSWSYCSFSGANSCITNPVLGP
jgi:hypothetical protein